MLADVPQHLVSFAKRRPFLAICIPTVIAVAGFGAVAFAGQAQTPAETVSTASAGNLMIQMQQPREIEAPASERGRLQTLELASADRAPSAAPWSPESDPAYRRILQDEAREQAKALAEQRAFEATLNADVAVPTDADAKSQTDRVASE